MSVDKIVYNQLLWKINCLRFYVNQDGQTFSQRCCESFFSQWSFLCLVSLSLYSMQIPRSVPCRCSWHWILCFDFLKASIHYTCLISADGLALVLFAVNIAATQLAFKPDPRWRLKGNAEDRYHARLSLNRSGYIYNQVSCF